MNDFFSITPLLVTPYYVKSVLLFGFEEKTRLWVFLNSKKKLLGFIIYMFKAFDEKYKGLGFGTGIERGRFIQGEL